MRVRGGSRQVVLSHHPSENMVSYTALGHITSRLLILSLFVTEAGRARGRRRYKVMLGSTLGGPWVPHLPGPPADQLARRPAAAWARATPSVFSVSSYRLFRM